MTGRPSRTKVMRAIRNMRRRKGGLRRARFEATLNVAGKIARSDFYKQEPVEYIQFAELWMAGCRGMTLEEWHANNARWENEEAKTRRKLKVIQGGKD